MSDNEPDLPQLIPGESREVTIDRLAQEFAVRGDVCAAGNELRAAAVAVGFLATRMDETVRGSGLAR